MLSLHAGHDSSNTSHWLPFLLAMPVLAGGYVWLTRKALRGWDHRRTAAWVAGCALVIVATSPLFADRPGPVAHMAQHLLLGMFAPLALMLAAPIRLLLATSALPTRRVIGRVLRSRPLHFLGHPVTATALSVGGLYAVMLTPLYAAAERNAVLHLAIHLHYLLAGYLFAWSIAGPDPAPRRPGLPLRAAVLIIAAAAHSVLAKLLYAQEPGFQTAAQLMYYGGDVAELLLATVLFRTWFRRAGSRNAPRSLRPSAVPR
ncbi:cytochrome c oxidase assembly protein [Kribbella sp. CA-293567]|uniref:cytochrome c oxidase assembly protein n=1 Tax=Kribbella sp. CA-293567 TaxID=3002436 RepID=UPI0022DD8DB9|nr:cytochrome c oxidase assembly protein [Kribbella sp. CA-293567]WBQ04491.1 cytochrome c oxidase assembly protein [Kribbella sp. CA-293567]